MTATERIAHAGVWLAAGFTVVFLMTPLVVTVAVSFGSSGVFTLPPPDWSLRWYEKLGTARGLWSSLATSLQVRCPRQRPARAAPPPCALLLPAALLQLPPLALPKPKPMTARAPTTSRR